MEIKFDYLTPEQWKKCAEIQKERLIRINKKRKQQPDYPEIFMQYGKVPCRRIHGLGELIGDIDRYYIVPSCKKILKIRWNSKENFWYTAGNDVYCIDELDWNFRINYKYIWLFDLRRLDPWAVTYEW